MYTPLDSPREVKIVFWDKKRRSESGCDREEGEWRIKNVGERILRSFRYATTEKGVRESGLAVFDRIRTLARTLAPGKA